MSMLERIRPSEAPTAFRLYLTDELRAAPLAQEIENAFFQSITLRNGTQKTTWHRRLDDLNALSERCLPAARPLEILDVAISSGVSTLEWLEALDRAGIASRITAGDAIVDAFLLTAGPLRALIDRTGYLMQLDIAGQAVRTPPPRRRDRLRYAPLLLFMKAAAGLFRAERRAGMAPGEIRVRLGLSCRALKLISRSLIGHPRIETLEDDILSDQRWERRFHVIRAANILNHAYFGRALLTRMLLNLRSRLAEGGLLIVCRTSDEGRNHATLFRLRADRGFEVAATLNDGSEVAELVLCLPPEARPPVS